MADDQTDQNTDQPSGGDISMSYDQLMRLIKETQAVPQPKPPKSPFQNLDPLAAQTGQLQSGPPSPGGGQSPQKTAQLQAAQQQADASRPAFYQKMAAQGGMPGLGGEKPQQARTQGQPGVPMSAIDAWNALPKDAPVAQKWATIQAMAKVGAIQAKPQGAGMTFDQRQALLSQRDTDAMARLQAHPQMVGAGQAAKNAADINPDTGKAAIEGGVAAAKALGTESEKIAQTINDQADAATTANITLKHIAGLAKDVQLGKLSGAKQDLSAWAQSLGLMDQQAADSTFGSAGSSQALTKAVLPLVTQAVHQLTSRSAVMEFNAFLKANPNIELTPDGFSKVVGWMQKVNDLAIDKQKYFQDWKQEHKPAEYQDFSYDWNKKVSKQMMDSPDEEQSTTQGLPAGWSVKIGK